MEVRKLRAGSRELSKVSMDGEGPYTAEYRTHGCDVSRMEGVVLLFEVVKVGPMLPKLCHSLAMGGQ